MLTRESMTPSEDAPCAAARAQPDGLVIRAREPSDWREIAALRQLPRVRWGTLALPFVTADATRKFLESPPDGFTGIVAVLAEKIVGTASIARDKGRCSHVGRIGMCVHDDFHGRGIGASLLAALIDTADNWLNLRRLELAVYVDNEPAIRLYRRFGFEIEGTRRAAAFRDGVFVDDHLMARLRGV
jgi:L-phenylalanine/L-methionine N-acetyltransferase